MLSERFLPADQVANGCVQELTRDPGNLTLWRALVRTTRNSMARCTVPGILQLYTRAISRINQLRVHRLAVTVEQDILGKAITSLQQTIYIVNCCSDDLV